MHLMVAEAGVRLTDLGALPCGSLLGPVHQTPLLHASHSAERRLEGEEPSFGDLDLCGLFTWFLKGNRVGTGVPILFLSIGESRNVWVESP